MKTPAELPSEPPAFFIQNRECSFQHARGEATLIYASGGDAGGGGAGGGGAGGGGGEQ